MKTEQNIKTKIKENGETVENTVKRAERAEETAEHAINEDRRYDKGDKKGKLPGEERAEHTEITLVDAIRKKSHSTFKRSCRTNILAEAGEREISECISYRKNEHEKD